jgi:capsular polysaccharide export protein
MKVNVLSFYSDFTSAFSTVNDYAKSNKRRVTISVNYCTHLSGFVAGVFSSRFKNVFLPVAVRINTAKEHECVADYTWVAEYLTRTGCEPKKSIRIAKLYVDYFITSLKHRAPEKIIISGDSRVQSRAMKVAADHLEIDAFYFEQGPFGTTVLDHIGVNANASFVEAVNWRNSDNMSGNKYSARKKRRSYWRILDYLFENFFLLLGFVELKEEKSISNVFKRNTLGLLYKTKREKSLELYDILLVGQVPYDANILLHSAYANFSEIIEKLQCVFPDKTILFREHPLYRGCYEKTLYRLAKKKDNFHISNCKNLNDDIAKCKNIVVVNSLTGLEVILRHRRSIWVLGDAIYGKLSACKITELDRFQLFEKEELTQAQYDEARNWFDANYLRGHFRDDNLDTFCEAVLEKIDDC